nr:MAG TPA: structural protein [Caudoviricetes sp.]
MAEIIKYRYEFDPTGRHEANLIKGERHTITDSNRTPQNIIVPGFAPFFENSLIVTDISTGYRLLEGIDYTLEWPVTEAAKNTENYVPLYGAIQFIDLALTGQYELQYQTIGGAYALDGVAIAQALANQAKDPLKTTYSAIIGKPLTFPPLEHVHSVQDFVGFNDLVDAVNKLIEAIQLLAREDRDNHPGYDTLIDSYFDLIEKLKQLTIKVDQNKEDFDNKLRELKNKIENDLSRAIADLTAKLAKEISDRTEGDKLLKDQLDALNDSLLTFIRTVFNPFKAATETDLSDLKAKLAALKAAHEKFKADTERTLEDHAAQIEANKPRWGVNIINQPTDAQLNMSNQKYVKVSQGALGAETYAGLAIETDPYNNDSTNRFTFEIEPNNGLHKFYRKQYEKNGVTNVSYSQLLNSRSGTIYNDGGAHYNVTNSSYVGLKNNGAPFFVQYKDREGRDIYRYNGVGGVLPFVKARFSMALNADENSDKKDTVTLGWVNTDADGTSGRTGRSGIILHYVQEEVMDNNPNTAEHNMWKFVPAFTGFQGGNVAYTLFRDPETSNVRLTLGSELSTKGLEITAGGRLRSLTNGAIFGDLDYHVWLNNNKVAGQNPGLRMWAKTPQNEEIPAYLEFNSNEKTFKLYRPAYENARGENVPAAAQRFPQHSGSVLLDSGTHYYSDGSYASQLNKKAPFFVANNGWDNTTVKNFGSNQYYYPVLKARFDSNLGTSAYNYAFSFGIYNNDIGEPKLTMLTNKKQDVEGGAQDDYKVYFPNNKNGTILLDSDGVNLQSQSYQVSTVVDRGYGGMNIKRSGVAGTWDARIEALPNKTFKFWTGTATNPDDPQMTASTSVTIPKANGNVLIDNLEQDVPGTKYFKGAALKFKNNNTVRGYIEGEANGVVIVTTPDEGVNPHMRLTTTGWADFHNTNGLVVYNRTMTTDNVEAKPFINNGAMIKPSVWGLQIANTMATKDSDVKYLEIGTLANRIYTNAKTMAIDGDLVRVYNSNINGNSCAVESGDQAIHVRADGWFDIRTMHGIAFHNDGNCYLRRSVRDGHAVVKGMRFEMDDFYMVSDKRRKHDIEKITNAVDIISRLEGKTFKLNDSDVSRAGVIAQELQEVLPNLVSEDENGYLAVNYQSLSGYFIEAIKEQQAEIEELKAKYESLEERLSKLENK